MRLETEYYRLSREDVAQALQTNFESGLHAEAAGKRLIDFGRNEITGSHPNSAWKILLAQFISPMVLLLFVASVLSFLFSEWMDAIAILLVLLINALVGFVMEYKAQQTMLSLKKLTSVVAKVLRNGQLSEIDSIQLVPGDIVFIEAGDMIPADGRICNLFQLQVDESTLTGESLPVEKENKTLSGNCTLGEQVNMLFRGTHASKGNGYFIVTATGMHTELGKVAHLVEKAEQAATPLEAKLEFFTRRLIRITIVLVVIIFIAGLVNHQRFLPMLYTSIALAVAAIPEGLPIVATLALAQGMIKMARRKVIVKQLAAVETLGGTNIICTDKTGTLTENKIEVVDVQPASDSASAEILNTMVLCNTAEVYVDGRERKSVGDPLEIALLTYAQKQNYSVRAIRNSYAKKGEEPFSSETKIMATLHAAGERSVVYAKGASEELIRRCDRILLLNGISVFTEELKGIWLNRADTKARNGLRVLAAAFKEDPKDGEPLAMRMVFVGLIGMQDPPRADVPQAIRECRSAGISVIMITGDHPSTAAHIAAQLGISDRPEVISGSQMPAYEELTEADKLRWQQTAVFARVSPQQKLDIVTVLQESGNIVAMTGDGVNDAPALKKADIGIAMGQRGTQVAQEVADMVIQDDSFSSIVAAIKQGRTIFSNIRKFVVYLLSCNLSELFIIAISAVLNLHYQLLPLQILFINLITDVLPALAIGVSRSGQHVMHKQPRSVQEAIVDRRQWNVVFIYASVLALSSFAAVHFSHNMHAAGTNPDLCNNVLFFSLIFSQLLHVFNMGEGHTSLFRSEIFKNKYVWISLIISVATLILAYVIIPVRKALGLEEMTTGEWLVAGSCSFGALVVLQVLKIFLTHKDQTHGRERAHVTD